MGSTVLARPEAQLSGRARGVVLVANDEAERPSGSPSQHLSMHSMNPTSRVRPARSPGGFGRSTQRGCGSARREFLGRGFREREVRGDRHACSGERPPKPVSGRTPAETNFWDSARRNYFVGKRSQKLFSGKTHAETNFWENARRKRFLGERSPKLISGRTPAKTNF